MPSDPEDGREAVETQLNRFISLYSLSIHWCPHCAYVCICLTSVSQIQCMYKHNSEYQGKQNRKNLREMHKIPSLNNALFLLEKSSACSTVKQKAFQRSAVMAECLVAAMLSIEPCTSRVK